MIVSVTAWTVLGGAMVIRVAVGDRDADPANQSLQHWQSVNEPAQDVDMASPRDMIAWIGESLIDMAHL